MAVKVRIAMILVALLTFPLLAAIVSAKVAVEIDEPFKLEVEDLGLEDIASGGSICMVLNGKLLKNIRNC